MKELTIEEKANRYDEAIERAKKWYDANTNEGYRGIFEDIFPELKESEDERIRKELLQIANESEDSIYMVMTPDKRKRLIAWLEKQGNLMKALQISNAEIGELIEKNYYLKEQLEKQGEHTNFLNKIQIGDKVTRNEDGVLVNLSQLNRVAKKDEKQGENNMGISEATKQKLEDNLNKALEKETPESCNEFLEKQGSKKETLKERNICDTCEDSNGCLIPCCAKLLEKQGEQKPTDKIKPKFKVGDIVKHKDNPHLTYILKRFTDDGDYEFHAIGKDGNEGCTCFSVVKYQDEWELVEQKPTVEMKTPEESLGIDSDTYNKIVDECIYGAKLEDALAWLEKQGKQNPCESCEEPRLNCQNFPCERKKNFDSANKVEPKFKVGDWVIGGATWNNPRQIAEIRKDGYITTYRGWIGSSFEEDMHLWSIKDAKPGDVLACENGWTCIFKTLVNNETFSSYCFMDNTKWFCETGSECHTLKEEFVKAYNGKIHPATKEQCEQFKKAMVDAGYVWDEEKKELKKIEQKPADWSEEDETRLTNIIIMLKEGASHHFIKDDITKAVDWLKSLRPQNHWKPTEEQVEAFEHFVRSIGESGYASPYENNTKLLYSLLNDLEKLIE